MYARIVKFEGADPARREEAIETVRENVLPRLKELEGFGGYIGLMDADRRVVKALTLWETKEAAEAAEEAMGPRRQQIAESVGLTIAGVALYEAPLVEIVHTARV